MRGVPEALRTEYFRYGIENNLIICLSCIHVRREREGKEGKNSRAKGLV